MPKNTYTFIGQYDYKEMPIIIEGKIDVDPINIDETYCVEGIIKNYRTNQKRKLKGFVKTDIWPEDDLDDKITILMVEYPIKNDASNIMHHLERKIPKNISQRVNSLDGRYLGETYTDVKIEIPEKALFEEITDINIAEFVFTELEFDAEKGSPAMIELKKCK